MVANTKLLGQEVTLPTTKFNKNTRYINSPYFPTTNLKSSGDPLVENPYFRDCFHESINIYECFWPRLSECDFILFMT